MSSTTRRKFRLSFSNKVGKNGYMYEIQNLSSLAVEIDGCTVQVEGYNGEPGMFTMRTLSEESRVSNGENGYEIPLDKLLSGTRKDVHSIEAKGSQEFVFYFDLDVNQKLLDVTDSELELVLKKGDTVIDRNTLPPN